MREAIKKDPGLALLLLALALAAALYAPVFTYGLTNYDDTWLVRDNVIVQDASWDHARTIVFDLDSPQRFVLTPEYLPIRDFSVMGDFALWGDWYGGHHLTNLVIYLLAIYVWFRALTEFGVDRRVAGLAMLLWAIHPAHAESVAWLSERKGLLGALFAGSAVLHYARFRIGYPKKDALGHLALAAITAAFAVWSKAPAAFGVAAIAPLELLLPQRRASWRGSLTGLGVVAAIGIAAYIPVVLLATRANVVAVTAPGGRLTSVAGAHGFYVELAAMAMPNAQTYPIATDGPSTVDIVLGLLGLAGLAVALAHPRSPREVKVGAALWLLGWFPVSHLLLPLQMVFVADRYALLPTLGSTLLLAAGLTRIPRPPAKIALATVVILAAALRTLDARSTWSSNRALWARAVESAPHSADAWSQLSEAETNPDEAMRIVDDGIAHVDTPKLYLRKALLLNASGRRAEAMQWMQRAADGGEAKGMSNLALLLPRGPEALAWAKRAIEVEPLSAHAHRTMGVLDLDLKKNDEAVAEFRRAYSLEPANLANRFNLAVALVAIGDISDAIPHFEACVTDPRFGEQSRVELSRLKH